MSRELFGTDGIRGMANLEPMTAETALRVAMAAALHIRNGHHQTVVIGKDTRLSGYLLEPAMTRSEEHTSELQSLMRNSYAVFCVKKKKRRRKSNIKTQTQ